jgi:hypothetical protein
MYGLLAESKLDDLKTKIGLSEQNAETIFEIFKNISIIFANKLIEKVMKENDIDKRNAIEKINLTNYFVRERQKMVSIKDYITVDLHGKIETIKDLTFDEIYKKSVEWHDSLTSGEAKINYEENEDDIIIDLRDANGNGFYWVALNTNDSREECERMGHCGRSEYGYLYSLREYKTLKPGYTLNESHLTAAIGPRDGMMYQLKGAKNSKPLEKFHPYILELLNYNDDGDYLVNGFKSEYAGSKDFSLSDLSGKNIAEIYAERPEIFNKYKDKKKLIDLGLADPSTLETKFILEIPAKFLDDYIELDRYTRSDIFEIILSDPDRLVNPEHTDWKESLEYSCNRKNEVIISDLLDKMAIDNNIDISELSIEEAIEELDADDIINAINLSANDAYTGNFYSQSYHAILDALVKYGNVKSLEYTGATLEIDLNQFKDIDFDIEECEDDDLECIFNDYINSHSFEKPRYEKPDYVGIDKNDFNEILSNRLADL